MTILSYYFLTTRSEKMPALIQVILVAIALCTCAEAKRDYTAYCGACKAVIDEIKYSVSKEDQHKTVQTGNYRVDSQGRQGGIKNIKYAGSEMHVIELLEKVCELMQNYGETSDPKTGKKGYMRINSRAGETISISNVNFSSGGAQELRTACDYFVSEHEEDIVQLMQEEQLTQDNMVQELCEDITGYCKDSRHTEL